MQLAVVDRFEGELAVLLVGDERQPFDVRRSHLPPGTREGQWLRVEIADGQLLGVSWDDQATAAAQERIAARLARLRRGDHLKDEKDKG
jgi:hypothetical protein